MSPSEFLRTILGDTVTIRLTTGVDFRGNEGSLPRVLRSAGRLLCLDSRMNAALAGADEIVNQKVQASYPADVFLRGNNGQSRSRRQRHLAL